MILSFIIILSQHYILNICNSISTSQFNYWRFLDSLYWIYTRTTMSSSTITTRNTSEKPPHCKILTSLSNNPRLPHKTKYSHVNNLDILFFSPPSARTRACFSSSYLLQQVLNPHTNSKQIGQSSLKDAGFQQVPRETLWHRETKQIRPFTKGGVIITQPVTWFGAISCCLSISTHKLLTNSQTDRIAIELPNRQNGCEGALEKHQDLGWAVRAPAIYIIWKMSLVSFDTLDKFL